MVATVEVRLIGDDLGRVMGEMRNWLDHRKMVPHAFRESRGPGGVALHVEFYAAREADEFAGRFQGRVLGNPPRPHGEPHAA